MQVQDARMTGDTLTFSLHQYGKHYELSCALPEIVNGTVKGVWKRLREDGTTSPEFEWEGTQVDRPWYPEQNPALIPIDRFGVPSGDHAICRVWPDPHVQLFLEPDIIPAK